jgi:hypothetical protein
VCRRVDTGAEDMPRQADAGAAVAHPAADEPPGHQQGGIVVEANSLHGLTPATVFYHQGLAEDPPLPPRDILEMIVDLADSPGT